MKIGVISDTHNQLRPEVLSALESCDVILHGGDVSRQEILDRLKTMAPVYAVRGNNDKEWAEYLPMCLDFTIAGLHLFMTHKKKDLPADLSGYDLVVYGHSHKYEELRSGRTLLLNPGSCGPRRFHQPITMATVQVKDGTPVITRIDIPHSQAAQKPDSAGPLLKPQVEAVIRETRKGRSISEIAVRQGLDQAVVEQIVRLYVTHPGVTADGIMTKMGL